MNCRTVIELTPDELAQLVGDAVAQRYGLGESSIQMLGPAGETLTLSKVRIEADCQLRGAGTGSPVGDRLAELRRRYDQLTEFASVEPFHQQQNGDASGD